MKGVHSQEASKAAQFEWQKRFGFQTELLNYFGYCSKT